MPDLRRLSGSAVIRILEGFGDVADDDGHEAPRGVAVPELRAMAGQTAGIGAARTSSTAPHVVNCSAAQAFACLRPAGRWVGEAVGGRDIDVPRVERRRGR